MAELRTDLEIRGQEEEGEADETATNGDELLDGDEKDEDLEEDPENY